MQYPCPAQLPAVPWSSLETPACLLYFQLDNDNITLKPRPQAELANSSAPSPSHKVQRSVSANPKQRRFSDQGEYPPGSAPLATWSLSEPGKTAKLLASLAVSSTGWV